MPDSTLKTKFWQTGLADLEQQLGVGRDGLSSADACDLLREVRARSRKRGKHSRLAFVVKPSLMSRTRSTTSLSKSRRISSNSRVRPDDDGNENANCEQNHRSLARLDWRFREIGARGRSSPESENANCRSRCRNE